MATLRLPHWTPLQRLRAGLGALIALAICALGLSLADTVSGVLERKWLTATPPPPPAVDSAAPAPRLHRPVSDFAPVLAINMFHARRSGGSPGVASGAAPPKIVLTGTFVFGSAAYAFITNADGQGEGVYEVGECLPRAADEAPAPRRAPCQPNQARLLRVQADRVLVELGGRREEVTIQSGAESAQGQQAANPAGGGAAAFVATQSGNTIEMHIPSVEVEKAFENFAEIVKQALVVPFSQNGQTVGFRIVNIQPGSIFQKLGLQNQDLIKGVNGQAVTSADQALRVLTLFRNDRHVTLDVERGGQPERLSYTID